MNKIIAFMTCISIGISMIKAPIPFEAISLEERAEMVGLDVESFILFSSVVEAESNRSQEDNSGRVMIAVCIWNRINSERWPDSATGVLTQSGQFSTVRRGQSVVNRTDLSDQAVIEAFEWVQEGTAPDVQFFNCRGFFSGVEPYECVGGNYFSYGY